MSEAAEALWRATDLFDARHEKSASVLVALERTLARRRPLHGAEQEFLDLYARAAAADPVVFTAVWPEPRAYFWVRLAYQLVSACLTGAPLTPLATAYHEALGEPSLERTLTRHLSAFKELCLALAIRGGDDWIFHEPLRATLPFTFAGSRFALEGTGPIDVLGVVDRGLRIVYGGRQFDLPLSADAASPAGAPALAAWPVVRHHGCELIVNPRAFAIPGLDMGPALAAVSLDFQERYAPLMRDALVAIERHAPLTFAHMGSDMRLIALKRPAEGPFTNVSYSELPGACVVSVLDHPLAIADRLIHEYHHNRLFALEERAPFFDATAGDASTDARHYSPWRNDQRPLKGLFHAVYVYVPVTRFWLRLHCDDHLAVRDRTLATERLVRNLRRLALAVGVLDHHAHFTPAGRIFFDELVRDVADLRADSARAGVPADVPALRMEENGTVGLELSEVDARPLSVNEAIAEHVRLYDRAGECRDLGHDPLRTAPAQPTL